MRDRSKPSPLVSIDNQRGRQWRNIASPRHETARTNQVRDYFVAIICTVHPDVVIRPAAFINDPPKEAVVGSEKKKRTI